MRRAFSCRLAIVIALALGSPAAAQNYGAQPGYGPGPYQQPSPYQLGPSAPAGQPGGGPSLVGNWSGTAMGARGPFQVAHTFGPDGRYMSAMRFANGNLGRIWGVWRATPTGPNQVRLEMQLQGWLPRETCLQVVGAAPQCQPLQLRPVEETVVTFQSPTQFRIGSEATPNFSSVEARDPQPVLLQARAPERWINVVQPSGGGGGQAPITLRPYVTPGSRGPATSIPGLGGNCDDTQQRRICMNGTLYRGRDGCLRCDR